MSIQTYVPINDLPAPVTTGTTIQSFTDVAGDAWVARNGVNSGAWKRARDVLYARLYRSAALTASTSAAVFPWDTAADDPYTMSVNLGSASAGLQAPVSGLYQLTGLVRMNANTSGAYISAIAYINGAQIYVGLQLTGTGAGAFFGSLVTGIVRVGAGQLIQIQYSATSALGIQVGAVNSYFDCMYMGTG